ncbi:MAG: helix-turn-helix domain-containing protein [Acidimicrobiia bacterium]|nr:helix-turn-helix domain-containing protein [Acidimicrobiia bacterium]
MKALGDNTRYAIYLELARSPVALSTADISTTLDLHVNTVRPHLERMREVGLLEVTTEARGGVGRPQHLYSLAPDAPSLGLEPPPFPLLARLLARLAAQAGVTDDDAVEIGREHGQLEAARVDRDRGCLDTLLAQQTELGFDPAPAADDESVTVAFANCPFGDLARQHPEIVCGLHCGMVEGLVESYDDAEVVEFRSLVHRTPCQVELVP